MTTPRPVVPWPSLHLLTGPQAKVWHKLSLSFQSFAVWEPSLTQTATPMNAANHNIVRTPSIATWAYAFANRFVRGKVGTAAW